MFNLFSRKNINDGVNEYKNTNSAKLIDVREVYEYKEGRIPNSINIPLSDINKIKNTVKDKDTRLFIYCLSGSRSAQATSILKTFGYTNVKDIGGISSYKGEIER